MKFALISHVLPPSGLGQSLVIQRLLEGLEPDRYCLASIEPSGAVNRDGSSPSLAGRCYWLPQPFRINRGHRFGLRHVREGINIPLTVLRHARRLSTIVKQEGCDAIVACTGDVTLIPAAYIASRRAGIPFYAYVFDHYSYREWFEPAAAFWARRFESKVMKGAAGIIAPNDKLSDDLRQRFGVDPVVIYNSFDISPYETNGRPAVSEMRRAGEVRIVYTGQIYEAHYDAFRNLIAAINSLNSPGVKLHLYTDRPQAELESLGILGPVVYHAARDAAEVPRVQMTADILFLPLAFESPYPNLVKTSATTKLGEYLAARRPVLVHAPPDSFISWYFREHDCGVVVDESDPVKLAAGISTIMRDETLRQRLGINAWTRARADFDVTKSRRTFAELIGLEGRQNR